MDRFSRTLHGYNPEEVNKFLDDVIVQVERIIESNKLKTKEIETLKKQLKDVNSSKIDTETIAKAKKFDELQGTLVDAIEMAKNTGEHMRVVAKKERNLIIEDAKRNANIIIRDALDKSKRIEYQADLLRKNIISFKRRLKVNLEEQIKLIDEIEVIDIENN
ncbi:MAG: DivIVA domain-containing protein [Bacilli bacterium]|nr:DivIVA domain-containing protein [Bacilli bacterium]